MVQHISSSQMRTAAFHTLATTLGSDRAVLPVRFDIERDTPAVFAALASDVPEIGQIVASLRDGLPLAPHCRIGAAGGFMRIPNHYRSVSWLFPSSDTVGRSGAIVFKGTEPLLPDFPEYFEWMLRAPFRSSYLPMALHFPLEMKLPPGTMWLEECLLEREITSRVQAEHLAHYHQLARLPVPLFVYQLTEEQVQRYRSVVQVGVPSSAFKRCEAKVAGGLGVEVYYYPSLPVRASDLLVDEIKRGCKSALEPEALDATFTEWVELMARMLHLGYMPYAPWNHGMGACVDPGNACIDGGFNDLLTLVPCSSIPGELLFRRSLATSIQLLSSSVMAVCSAVTGVSVSPQAEPLTVATEYVTARLRAQVLGVSPGTHHQVDARLRRYFETPSAQDVCQQLGETRRDTASTQFRPSSTNAGAPQPRSGAGADPDQSCLMGV